MSVQLHFSNRLDHLAERFADSLAAEIRARENILVPPFVVVPNANVAKWLQLFLAERHTVAMNLPCRYLEAGLWELLAALDPAGRKPEMLDFERTRILLLHILRRLDPGDGALLPVTRYLRGAPGDEPGPPDHAARCWQLADRLARLFHEYEFHRSDMVRGWLDGKVGTGSMERCQQSLYVELRRARERIAARGGVRMLSTLEYADRLLPDRGTVAAGGGQGETAHFFGLSQVSGFHLDLLGRLRRRYRLHIYALNPCEAFWEDIRTPAEKRWARRKRAEFPVPEAPGEERETVFGDTDHPLLAAWGKPGREGVRLLCELAGYDFSEDFRAPAGPASVLQTVQRSILTLSPAGEGDTAPPAPDRSLQIVACPGIRREVETVYQSILFNLGQDPARRLADVAVLVPDISAYKPVVDAVFNRRPGQLAYNLVDTRADIESLYGKAVVSLLKLATGRFSRSEVFELVLNPCFASRWKIGADDARAWAEWVRELNIFHTFDREGKLRKGYADSGRYTWRQGLERLRLSRVMATPGPGGGVHYRGRVPFGDPESGDEERVEKFCTVVETLHRTVEMLRAGRSGGRRWQRLLVRICERLFAVPENAAGEASVRQSLARAFDHLALLDELAGDGPPPELDGSLILEFVRGSLAAISGARGDYLTGGVTISSLQPMRPIPFDIVYVLGLDEASFPGRPETSSLDLRLKKRRLGDVSRPERNSYLFLEVLLSARRKLYLSYVARDLQKDRLIAPSRVVGQLKRYVETAVLPPGGALTVTEVPMSGASPRYADPGAVSASSDVLVSDSVADRVACYRGAGLWERFREAASPADLERAARFAPDLSPGVPPGEGGATPPDRVTVGGLKRFLQHPVRAVLGRRIGRYGDPESIEEVTARAEEPFFSEFPTDFQLKMGAVEAWVEAALDTRGPTTARPEPEAVCERVYADFLRMGRTPEGVFADVDRQALFESVGRTAAALDPLIGRMASAPRLYRALSIGDPDEGPLPAGGPAPCRRFEPVRLSIPLAGRGREPVPKRVDVHGRCSWLWQDGDKRWHFAVLTGAGKPGRGIGKHILEPLLFHLLGLAGGESRRWFTASGADGATFHLVYGEKVDSLSYRIDADTAGAYLQSLLAAYLAPSMAAWLPFDAVTAVKFPVRPHVRADGETDEAGRRAYAEALADAFETETDPLVRLAKPPIPADAFDTVRRRLGIFFEARRG